MKCNTYTPRKESYYHKTCYCFVNTGQRGWCKMLQCPCDGRGNYKPEETKFAPIFQHGVSDEIYYKEA